MTVAVTGNIQYHPVNPQPHPDLQHLYPIALFDSYTEAVGDATAGNVNITIPTKADKVTGHFLLLTEFIFHTDDTNAGYVYIVQVRTDWQLFNQLAANNIMIYNAAKLSNGTYASIAPSDRLHPIYLGQPTVANDGTILITTNVNTDTKKYAFGLRGFAFAKAPTILYPPIY